MHCDIKEWRVVGWATVEQEAIDTKPLTQRMISTWSQLRMKVCAQKGVVRKERSAEAVQQVQHMSGVK